MQERATMLPAEFSRLQRFAQWSLASETERNVKRHASTMDGIVAFKDAMLPEIDAIVAYLNGFAQGAMPPEALALMYMLLSLAEVAPAVEFYRQPAVIDGFDPRRFVAQEGFVLRPEN